MPLEIAGMEFAYLSGPIGMCILTPSKKLISNLKKGYDALPICGFEDVHFSIKKNCYQLNMCKENDTSCVTLYTPMLYRLLDQLATKEYSINLFMEIGFFPYLLKNDKLISPERLSIFKANDGSMTYIARNHAACLSTSRNTENKLCFTSNLKYHLSDLRYQPNHLQLTNEEKKLISIANKLVIESPYLSFPLKDLYSIAEEMASHKNPNEPFESLITHFPTFESYMLDTFKKCRHQSNIMFYDMKASDLLKLAVTNTNGFINRLIKFPQWMTRSVFADRMSSSIFPFNLLVTMWKQYIDYAFFRYSKGKPEYKYHLEALTTIDDRVFSEYYHPKYKHLRTGGSRERLRYENRLLEVENEEFDEVKENVESLSEAREYFSGILDDAMMEFYFLLTSWKKEHNNSMLSIFSAGATHIKNVRFFMQQHGYYNTRCVESSKSKRVRCVAFHQDMSLSKWLLSFWNKMNRKKQYVLYQQLTLQVRRVQLLGNDIMYKILNGNAVPSSVVEDKVKDIKNLRTLDLINITIPSQYADKQLTL